MSRARTLVAEAQPAQQHLHASQGIEHAEFPLDELVDCRGIEDADDVLVGRAGGDAGLELLLLVGRQQCGPPATGLVEQFVHAACVVLGDPLLKMGMHFAQPPPTRGVAMMSW